MNKDCKGGGFERDKGFVVRVCTLCWTMVEFPV